MAEKTSTFESRYPAADELPVLEPLPVPREEFPQDPEVPEGCIVLDGMADTPDYSLDYREQVYVTRELEDGTNCDLRLYALVPCEQSPLRSDAGEATSFPVVVFCQGSAFHRQWLHGHFVQHVDLARRGFVVVSVEYRPSDVAPFPAQAQDLKTAVRYVRAHADELRADPDRIALWGDSSGAHTALMAAYTADAEPDTDALAPTSSAVSCVIDWYGPTDFSLMNRYPSSQDHMAPRSPEGFELGGVTVLEHPELSAAASPITYVTGGRRLPATLIVHGGRDELVAFNQSCRLYERLRATGQDVTFYKLPDANHGKAGFSDPRLLDLVEDFLREHL